MQANDTARPIERFAIRASVIVAGATLMALEMLAFRLIGKTFGTALRETSIVISVFLGAMAIGYALGGRFADRRPMTSTLAITLWLASASIAAVPALDALLSERIFASSLPLSLHSAVMSLALFVVPSITLAAVTPMAIRLLARTVDRSGTTAGSLSAQSTFGSIVGSVATAFVLIDFFESVTATVIAVAILIAVTAVFLAAASGLLRLRAEDRTRWSVKSATAFVAGLVIIAIALTAAVSAHRRELATHVADYGARVVVELDTPYHHLIVRDSNDLRTLYFDRQMQSSIRRDDPLTGGFRYTDYFHMPMILRPGIRNVLFIGLGGGTGPNRFVHDYPNVVVDVAEVDPVVIRVAREYFGLEAGPRLRLHHADGRAFVRLAETRYDLIVLDAYSTNRYGSTIPAHLTTREFFAECAARMTPEGILLFHLYVDRDSLIARSIAKTIASSFPHIITFSDRAEIVASRAPIATSRADLVARATELERRGAIRFPGLVARAGELNEEPMRTIGVRLFTDDYAPVDTLMRDAAAQ
jgi:predicted membrane-bound spermidine synthase